MTDAVYNIKDSYVFGCRHLGESRVRGNGGQLGSCDITCGREKRRDEKNEERTS